MAMNKMNVKVQRCTIINHCNGRDAKIHEVPLNVFDLFASNIHVAVLYAFTPPTSSNSDIIQGLSKTLPHFPTLMSRLGRDRGDHPCLLLGGTGDDGGGGALVVEATVDSNLSDHMPFEPSPDFTLLHPSTDDADHVFQVQLNRFRCGGLVIGVTAHHRVADGQSISNFTVAWGRAVRGAPVGKLPVFDQSWLRPRSPPRCDFQHWGLEFATLDQRKSGALDASNQTDVATCEFTNLLLHYPSEFITKLKSKTTRKYTTFETILAHMWRKITIARELGDEVETMIRISVNGRTRLRPPVADEFFGNLVLNAYPISNVRLLLERSLEYAAERVHEAILQIDHRYFQSIIDFGELNRDEELVPVYDTDGLVLSPIIEVDTWLRFRFKDVDFGGGGKLVAFVPTWLPFEGLVIVLPSFRGDGGGVDVIVTLIEEHADRLKQISHSLE